MYIHVYIYIVHCTVLRPRSAVAPRSGRGSMFRERPAALRPRSEVAPRRWMMFKMGARPVALRPRPAVAPPSSGSGREARRLLQIRMPGGGAIAVAEDVDLGTVEYLTIPVAILPHRSWHSSLVLSIFDDFSDPVDWRPYRAKTRC